MVKGTRVKVGRSSKRKYKNKIEVRIHTCTIQMVSTSLVKKGIVQGVERGEYFNLFLFLQ